MEDGESTEDELVEKPIIKMEMEETAKPKEISSRENSTFLWQKQWDRTTKFFQKMARPTGDTTT